MEKIMMIRSDRGSIMDTQLLSKTILSHFPKVEAIYLFGSHATSDERTDSDIDIAVLFPPEERLAGNVDLESCRQAIEEVSKKAVDLIELHATNTVLQHEIIQEGRAIFRRSDFVVDQFEMLVMSKYQKLNEERAGILQDIFQDGRIFASH
jgi:predicted nucleotidyltransferase